MAVLHHGRLHAWGRPEELARELWDGFDVAVDLDRPADERLVAAVTEVRGVLGARAVDQGLLVRVVDREAIAPMVHRLHQAEVAVYAVEPRRHSLEDVYFEIEARAGSQHSDIDPDLIRAPGAFAESPGPALR